MNNTLTFNLEADELEIFVQDVNEQLRAMESGILSLEQAADPDTLNAIFRAAHTLKAVASTVGHHPMADLTHTLETLFDALRAGAFSLTQEMTDDLLTAVDVLRALRDEVISRQPSGVDVVSIIDRMRQLIKMGVAGQATGEERAAPAPSHGPGASRLLTPSQSAQANRCREQGDTLFEIQVAANRESFAPAARLLQVMLTLAEIGQVLAQSPSENDLLGDWQDNHLWLVLATKTEIPAIQERLGDVSELAEFQVRPYTSEVETTLSSLSALPLQKANHVEKPDQEQDKTVHISVERLDALMDLVGEMVTDRTRLAQIKETLRARYGKREELGALNDTLAHIGQIIDQLQDEVMRARMLPIAQIFSKFPRLVRDLARTAGKQVNLVIEGEATELDRSLIEAIGDPLIHLLRNAMDHGIESPPVRAAAGKPPVGTVLLRAEHKEGQIVITVQDDGQGIDPQQTRQAAVRLGLLSEEESLRLSHDEAIALIFQPGLSTAKQITAVSGRGVGLDVVRANISRIGGTVVVESEMRQGVTFRVTLPLTLAIVQTMLVGLGSDVYAIPLTSIVESLYLSGVQINSVKGNPATCWRDGVLPLLNLRQFFYNPRADGHQSPPGKPAIVAVTWGRLQAGLIVDRIIGKQEIVVKPFGPVMGTVPGLAGCTILGDGRIALIVDVPGVINLILQAQRQEGPP